MYLAHLRIENFRLFGSADKALSLNFTKGINTLIGENDTGKSTIIDAIRLVLGTSSQDLYRIEDTDFYVINGKPSEQFMISCRFDGIEDSDGSAFSEHLTWEESIPHLYVTMRVRRTYKNRKRWIDIDVRTGKSGTGNRVEGEIRNFLRVTYLKALRDADRELSAGRNSRLSQILQHTHEIQSGNEEKFQATEFIKAIKEGKTTKLPQGLAAVSSLAELLIESNEGVQKARTRLDQAFLNNLALAPDTLSSQISVANPHTDEIRIRQILEKLELSLEHPGAGTTGVQRGLGYNNLLFMACELLLLANDKDQLPLLLVEEPEAHLHPQLQLRLIDFLQTEANKKDSSMQVIITTHSPNLASSLKLDGLILLAGGRAFPLEKSKTLLSEEDYQFLERFLDVTKANLFFARGVVIVEGDAEYILLPTLAKLLGRDFSRYGVSIVNVGSRGLRRYSNIFRRRDKAEPPIPTPVACLADLDILPPQLEQKYGVKKEAAGGPAEGLEEGEAEATVSPAPTVSDQEGGDSSENNRPRDQYEKAVARKREALKTADGGMVSTFVANYLTFEYDLARSGLRSELNQAVQLALEEFRISDADRKAREKEQETGKKREKSKTRPTRSELIDTANAVLKEHEKLTSDPDELAYLVYQRLQLKLKAMTAQHLATILIKSIEETKLTKADLLNKIPKYLQDAISYVTEPLS